MTQRSKTLTDFNDTLVQLMTDGYTFTGVAVALEKNGEEFIVKLEPLKAEESYLDWFKKDDASPGSPGELCDVDREIAMLYKDNIFAVWQRFLDDVEDSANLEAENLTLIKVGHRHNTTLVKDVDEAKWDLLPFDFHPVPDEQDVICGLVSTAMQKPIAK